MGPRAALWLEARAEAGGAIETIIRQGSNIDAFTKELAPRLNEATDDTRAVEPFAVEVEDYRAKPAITAMARKKQLGLIELGFGELDHTSEADADDWGYLVAWYYRGAVVGFVYHATQQLELDAVETETASLVEMLNAELPNPDQ